MMVSNTDFSLFQMEKRLPENGIPKRNPEKISIRRRRR
jgi:hypothetical protein